MPSAWVCEGGTQDGPQRVAIALGDRVKCTITNTAQIGRWTIRKSSDPVSGSTVEPGDVITYTTSARKLDGVDPQDVSSSTICPT